MSNSDPQRFPRVSLVAGASSGLLIVAWVFVMGLTGWYRDPATYHLFWITVGIEAVVILAALWWTRRRPTYSRRVAIGLIASAVAAPIVFVGWTVFTTLAFPSYFDDLRAVRERTLRARGLEDEAVEATLDGMAASQTPTGQAFAGFMGTLGTGFVVSLAGAAVLRGRARQPVR